MRTHRSDRRLRLAALAVALAAAVGLAAPPALGVGRATGGSPPGPVVTCGAVLTESARLAGDLECPSGQGLTLAADGITLDLGGHTFSSPHRWPDDPPPATDPGIRVRAHDVTIRNGSVVGWAPGVKVGQSLPDPGSVPGSAFIRGVRFEGNANGVEAYDGADLTVTASSFVRNGSGGDVQVSGRLRVSHVLAEGNFNGFSAFGTTQPVPLTIRGALIRDNENGVLCSTSELQVEGVVFTGNTVGLYAGPCTGTVRRSVFVDNDTHLYLPAPEAVPIFACVHFAGGGGDPGVPVEPCRRPGLS